MPCCYDTLSKSTIACDVEETNWWRKDAACGLWVKLEHRPRMRTPLSNDTVISLTFGLGHPIYRIIHNFLSLVNLDHALTGVPESLVVEDSQVKASISNMS